MVTMHTMNASHDSRVLQVESRLKEEIMEDPGRHAPHTACLLIKLLLQPEKIEGINSP